MSSISHASYRQILFLCLFVLSGQGLRAQNFEFSQFFASRLYLNPTFAAAEEHLSISGVHRSQWTSISEAYTSTQVSLIHPLTSRTKKMENWGGIGLSLVNDNAANGLVKNTGANASFAYNLPLKSKNEKYVSFGMMLGFIQKQANIGAGWGNQYRPGSGLDPSLATGEEDLMATRIMPDVGVGVSYNAQFGKKKRRRKNLSLGLSGYQLNSPNESLVEGQTQNLPPVIKTFGRIDIPSHLGIYISPNYIVVYQAGLIQINPGVSAKFPASFDSKSKLANVDIIAGIWHRLEDSFIFATGLNTDKFTFAFSYDLNTSSLNNYTNGRGAVEISFAYRYIKKVKMEVERKRFDTPRM